MQRTSLWEIYYGIENVLDELSGFDSYSPYQETLGKLEDGIESLYKYFGIRKLKMDIGDFKKGEVVQVEQDRFSVWLLPLKYGDHKMVDMSDYMDIPDSEMFY